MKYFTIQYCWLFIAISLLIPGEVFSQQAPLNESDSLKAWAKYGKKGFEMNSRDGRYRMHIELRLQARIAYPYENDPITFEDFNEDNFFAGINRARFKMGGHAFAKWFTYYMEYELFASKLLDFRMMFKVNRGINFKIGQWKAHYTRERVVSSGKQQAVDRSILNYPFTIDRQQGISMFGNFGRKAGNFSYWLSILMGTGRGATSNDDGDLMYMGRLQWNPKGKPVPFVGGDLSTLSPFLFSLAVGGVTNESPYTRFSTSGGGNLPEFPRGEDGQYRVNQAMVETAFIVKGFSWHQELHWKEIDDKINEQITTLLGNVVQIGYFFHALGQHKFPKQLEFFFRQGVYDPSRDLDQNLRLEYTAGANWFFNGHRNKLTLGFSHIDFQDAPETIRDGNRVTLQIDFSF